MELRIARLGKKRSQRSWLHRCGGPIPKHLGPLDRPTLAQSRDPHEFSNCSGRQRGELPIQIPITVALHWPSGWNSPAANADRSKLHRENCLACLRLSQAAAQATSRPEREQLLLGDRDANDTVPRIAGTIASRRVIRCGMNHQRGFAAAAGAASGGCTSDGFTQFASKGPNP